MSDEKETKSPIKNLPVRVPGQSLDEQIAKILDDKFLEIFLFAGMLCILAFFEWWRVLFALKPMPWIFTVMALVAVCWATFRIRKLKAEVKALRLGLTGERAVGQYLEEMLRPHNFHVLHDVLGEGFNLDHVIVGPTGVFCVETKTRSKPVKGSPTIQYDGETITVDRLEPDRDPIVQAKAEARWLHELLESSTGKKFPVRPIVVFPGWYVERMPENADVWVLNEKAVSTFILNAKTHLNPEDVSLITFHLKRYVISEGKKA